MASQTASTLSRVHPPAKTERLPKKFLLGGAKEVVAPVDRGAESLLALRKVACATGEQLQAAGEASAHGGDGKNLDAGGCEFDRKGQAIQAAADFDDGGGVFLVQLEIGFGCAGTLQEERDCGAF